MIKVFAVIEEDLIWAVFATKVDAKDFIAREFKNTPNLLKPNIKNMKIYENLEEAPHTDLYTDHLSTALEAVPKSARCLNPPKI